jgi:hypothetical protein
LLEADVHPKLDVAWPANRRTAEKRAFQQILLVEDILDVERGPDD